MLDDYESAPIDSRLRETLRFLETMTLDPDVAFEAVLASALAAGEERRRAALKALRR